MSLNDISLIPSRSRNSPTGGEVAFPALACSLVVVLFVMTWALPFSAMLAINLFRVSVVLWLLLTFRRGSTWSGSPIFLPMLCFLAVTAIATMLSLDRFTSWQEMKSLELAFAAVIVSDAIRSPRVLRWLVSGLLTTSFVIAALAGWQYFHRADPVDRVQGLYRHYVNFGEMLLLVAALSFGIAVAAHHSHVKIKAASAIVFAGTAASLLATETRTFIAALLLACFYMVWLKFRWRVRALAAVVLSCAVIAGAWWFQSHRGFSWFDAADPGTQYRFLIWKDASHIIRQHPLFGVGLANVQRHPAQFQMSAYASFPNMISHFHSVPIEIAADCGLPALAIWTWLMITCWSVAKKSFTQAPPEGELARGIALGVLGAIVAFQFSSLFHYILGDSEPMLLFWTLVGAAVILDRRTVAAEPC